MNRKNLLKMFHVGMGMKPTGKQPSATKCGPGRISLSKFGVMHIEARNAGISKAFRQYAKRYGGLDVTAILQIDRQCGGMIHPNHV